MEYVTRAAQRCLAPETGVTVTRDDIAAAERRFFGEGPPPGCDVGPVADWLLPASGEWNQKDPVKCLELLKGLSDDSVWLRVKVEPGVLFRHDTATVTICPLTSTGDWWRMRWQNFRHGRHRGHLGTYFPPKQTGLGALDSPYIRFFDNRREGFGRSGMGKFETEVINMTAFYRWRVAPDRHVFTIDNSAAGFGVPAIETTLEPGPEVRFVIPLFVDDFWVLLRCPEGAKIGRDVLRARKLVVTTAFKLGYEERWLRKDYCELGPVLTTFLTNNLRR